MRGVGRLLHFVRARVGVGSVSHVPLGRREKEHDEQEEEIALKTEEYTDPQAFLAALSGSHRRTSKRAQSARPDLPRAGQAERTGLSTFLKAGWAYTWWPAKGYRLDNRDGRTSGWCDSEQAACDAAKRA